ncbi:MAG: hypothetical protein M1823_005158 [Watsoniomyces obsoletus]|nr:MAG: hypothetical protein M1823_005158 [Watsoniomyces obsoletus]
MASTLAPQECLQLCREALCMVVCAYQEPYDILSQLRPGQYNDPIWGARTAEGRAELIFGFLANRYHSDIHTGFNSPLWLVAAIGREDLMEQALDHTSTSASSERLEFPIQVAVYLGHKEVVRLLLKTGTSIYGYGLSRDSLLHHAVRRGKPQIVELLIQHGADVSAQNLTNTTPLSLVWCGPYMGNNGNKDVSIARQLLEHGADPNVPMHLPTDQAFRVHPYPTLLIAASTAGNSDLVELLIRFGVKLDPAPRPDGDNNGDAAGNNNEGYESALAMAIDNGHGDIARMLLAAGANPLGATALGDTTLMCAVRQGHLGLIQLLIDHGMPVNHQIRSGETALETAMHYWASETTIQILIENGATVNPNREVYRDYLGRAAWFDEGGAARVLLENVVLLDDTSRAMHGEHLLTAASYGYTKAVERLLDQGVPVNFCDDDRGSALHVSIKSGNMDLVRLLLEEGADVNLRPGGAHGISTALHLAIDQGSLELVRLLIQHGADVEAVDDCRGTPLGAARINGRKDMLTCSTRKRDAPGSETAI